MKDAIGIVGLQLCASLALVGCMAETGDFENQGIDTLSESDIGESSEALLSFPGGFSMDLWRVLADDVEKRTDLDVVASSAAKFESHGAWQVLVEGPVFHYATLFA